MNALMLAIFFFSVIFMGSLLYSVKSKKDTLVSFLINLEIEYVLLGILVYFVARLTIVPELYFLKAVMHLVLAFMGLVVGTHFSIKLLASVPKKMFAVSLLIYIAAIPLLYIILYYAEVDNPLMYSIMLNTLMPYSVNLGSRLFKIKRESIYLSGFVASLFPFISLSVYTFAAGFHEYRPKDFFMSLFLAIFFSLIFAVYGKHKSRKIVHQISIMFVFVIAGISQYEGVSPLVIGFLIGFLLSDTGYGNIFHNISISFERFFYIFFYVVLGIILYGFESAVNLKMFFTVVYICVVLFIVRQIFAKIIIKFSLPLQNNTIALYSTGVLPVVLMLDYGIRQGFDFAKFLAPVFMAVHIITEITSYLMMKNAKKHN